MTDQSRQFSAGTPIDPITALMGTLPADELELRLKLYRAGQFASYIPYETDNKVARQLCWIICDLVREWQFAPASLETLEEIVKRVRRLSICANDFQLLEAWA